MKRCSSCGKIKDFESFQKRIASNDGLTASCKLCLAIRDRNRYPEEKENRLNLHKLYMATDDGIKSHNCSVKKYRKEHPKRYKANNAVNNALRDGKINKLPCFCCGDLEVEAHHPDYDNVLGIVWLCVMHHRELHLKYPEW